MKRDNPGQTRSRILAWIKNHDEGWTPDEPTIHISLATETGGRPADSLATFDYKPYVPEVSQDNLNETTAESIAQQILECAEEESTSGMGGRVTRFVVTSNGDQKPHQFTISPEAASALGEDNFHERANEQGLLFALMRHQEGTLKQALSTMEVQLEQSRRVIESQRAELDQAYEARRDQMKVYEELLSARHEREMEIRRVAQEEKRMDRAGDMLAPLIPVALNKIMGQKLLGEGKNHPVLEIARGIFTGMEKEQWEAMLGVLQPTQKLAMIELTKAFYAEKEAQDRDLEQRTRAAAEDNGSGESGGTAH